MMACAWDVAVVGAGPAGSMAAAACAGRGLATILIERAEFPRHKVCGCCLNEAAVSVIGAAGAGEALARLGGEPLHVFELFVGGHATRMPVRRGVAVSRAALDAALASHAQRMGAEVRFGVGARAVGREGGTWRVAIGGDGGEMLSARSVVIADGLGGRSLEGLEGWEWSVAKRSRLGLSAIVAGADVPRGVIRMAVGSSGYVGLVRLEDGSVDVGAAVNGAVMREMGSAGALVSAILREAGVESSRSVEEARFRGTPLLWRRRRRIEGEGIFVVGDAAGYVEPLTGEGMSWAVVGGVRVATHVERFVKGVWAAGEWTAAAKRLLARRRRRCAWVARAARIPAVLVAGAAAMRVVPRTAKWVGEGFGAPWRAEEWAV